MAFDFPFPATVGDIYDPLPGVTYTWDGTCWSYVSGFATLSITTLFPAFMEVGDADLPMRVIGVGFVPSSIIHFDGTPVPTIYGNGTELQTIVRASNETVPREVQVTVRTGAVESNEEMLNFVQIPVITVLNPTSISISGGPVTVTVTGTGFIDDSVCVLNDVDLVTTFVSTTQLTGVVEPTMGGAGDRLYFKVMTGRYFSSNNVLFDFTA